MRVTFNVAVFFLMCFAIVSCEKYDKDYKDFLDSREVIYPGLAKNVRYHAGNLRTVLVWNPSPDPSIKNYVVIWNNGADSVSVNAATHNPVDSISVSIPNLEEYVYSFKIIAYDNEGHISVGQEINNVRVYGPVYQSTLSNRLLKSALRSGNDAIVELFAGEKSSPYSKITYTTTANEEKVINVTNDETQVVLKDYKSLSKFQFQTYFLPDSTAIDTFRSEPQTYGVGEDVTNTYFKNPGRYIIRGDNGTGKWGTPKDWQFNSAATNQNGGTGGGWSTDDGGVIHFETKDWGGDGVNNGKVWQSFTLPEGKYTVDFETGNYGGSGYSVKEVIAAGTTLPNSDDLGNVLAVFNGDQNNLGGTHSLTFTLNQPTTVAIGFIVNTGQYTYLQFRSIKMRIAGSGF